MTESGKKEKGTKECKAENREKVSKGNANPGGGERTPTKEKIVSETRPFIYRDHSFFPGRSKGERVGGGGWSKILSNYSVWSWGIGGGIFGKKKNLEAPATSKP